AFAGGFGFLGLGHMMFLSVLVSGRDHRGLMAPQTKPPKSGAEHAERTGQTENWGRPSGGTDFPLERPGGGFRRASQKGRCGGGTMQKKERVRLDRKRDSDGDDRLRLCATAGQIGISR